MKKKIYQLVQHTETPFVWYGIHEALIEQGELYWVGKEALKKFDQYSAAMDYWTRIEPMSSYVDVLDSTEAEEYYDRLDYSDEEELNFDD